MGMQITLLYLFISVMIVIIAMMMLAPVKGFFLRLIALIVSQMVLKIVIAPVMNRDMTFILLVVHVLLTLIIWALRSADAAQHRKTTESLAALDFCAILDVLSSDPELAGAGWFKTNWLNWSRTQRMAWCEHHLVGLKKLHIRAGTGGLPNHGNLLPVMLASLEQANPINVFPTQRSEA